MVNLYQITYPYDMSGTLENWLRRNTDISDLPYGEEVTCLFESEDPQVSEKIRDITKGAITPEFIETLTKEKVIAE
jgi:hypothetical protein